jgi:hypothetical protein
MSLEGHGQLILNANCAGGTIAIRGHFPVTDNAGGVVTLSDAGRYDEQQIRDAMKLAPTAGAPAAGAVDEHLDDILADTAAIDARLPADPADESVQLAAHALTQAGVAAVEVDTQDIQSRPPATLVGGRMDSDVGNMQPNVVDAAALASDAVNEIRDSILSDSTPFNGADIDQSLSATESNIRGSDGDDLKDISDEVAAVQADTDDIQTRLPAALVGGAMDADVSNIQAAALTQINNELEVTSGHGAGPWTSASSVDWTDAEKEQIRSALGIDGSKTEAVDGQLQQFHIAAIATVAAGGSATEVRTDLTQADGFWNNMVMIVEDVGGAGERVARNIDNYTNANGALYVFGGLPFTPASGDKVYIVARTGSLRDDNGPIGCL